MSSLQVPADEFMPENSQTIDSLAEMVADVNRTMKDEDVISFDVFHYAANTHRLEKAAGLLHQ